MQPPNVKSDKWSSDEAQALRAILKNVPDIVATIRQDGTISYINRTEHGYSEQQVVGSSIVEFVPPEVVPHLQEALHRVFLRGETAAFDMPIIRADGERACYSCRLLPIHHGERIVEALAVATDVTAHKEMESRFRKSEGEFQNQLQRRAAELARINEELLEQKRFIQRVADSSPFLLYVYDLVEGRNIFVNSQVMQLLGYQPHEIVEMGSELMARIIHPDDLASVYESLSRFTDADDGAIIETAYRVKNVNGEWRWFQSRDVVFGRQPDGSVKLVLGTGYDVTERRQAAEELERFKFLSDHSNDAHFFLDGEGQFLYVNRRACEMLGYSEDELLGMRVYEIAPGSETRLPDLLGRYSERIPPFEVMHRRKDGTLLPVEVSATGADFGGKQYIFAAVRDISIRKEMELQVKQSQQELEDFVENAPIGMQWVSQEGVILWANQTQLDLMGYSSDEYIGHHISEFHIDQSRIEDFLGRLAKGETLQGQEVRLRCRDGRVKHVLIDSNVRFEEGQFVHTRCFNRDVTESRKAREALRQHEERLRFILESSEIGTWEWEIRTGRMSWSDNMFEIHALPKEAFGGSYDDFLKDVHPEDRERVLASIAQGLNGKDHLRFEYRIVRTDRVFWVEGTGRVVRDDENQPVRVVGICRDITDRKHSEAKVRQQDRLAAIGTLAAGLAHELNNPLSAMLTSAQVASRVQGNPEKRAQMEEYLELIQAEGERIRQIVKNVASFAKQGSSLKAKCKLESVAQRVCERMKPYAQSRGVHLEMHCPQKLPELLANGTEIDQVLTNLLSNAVEASDAGKTVMLTLSPSQTSIRLAVQDQGCGMSEETQERIFDPFYTGREEKGGTGLGLSIVHRIVADHRGTIDVCSAAGEGTTMTVILPLDPGNG